ncbi:MAG: 16S rRNA (guanine(527)-N(7))-methyltransferase RsmG [Elusimicrobia bacterium]|nr:16S rRNA (guanine(527)-N(7))-methyltransferase RsmG [Elusimicrobiota bacterium]
MKENVWNTFKTFVCNNFNVSLSENQINLFKIYLSELKIWNQKFNLVSFKNDEEIIFRHFADSLAALKIISKFRKQKLDMADIGTGAGFPGIPIKIAIPEMHLKLIESITKKCSFLENLKAKLLLSDTEIINDRAENIGQDKKYREKSDFVVSRALSKFSPNLEMALPLTKVGGHCLIFKTESSAFGKDGINSVEKAYNVLGGEFIEHFCYNLPDQDLTYCILVFEKIKNSPKEFPRKVGIPGKKPL